MKLPHLKNIIKEELKTLKEQQGGSHYTATIQCMQGFYPKITNLSHPTPIQTTAVPHATYTKALGDDICFTCVPVRDQRAPMDPTMG